MDRWLGSKCEHWCWKKNSLRRCGLAGCKRRLRPKAAKAGPMKALRWLLHVLLRCHHRQLTRVFTISNRTYQVCIACGREIDYSWELMHSVQPKVGGNASTPTEPRQASASSLGLFGPRRISQP